MLRNAVRVLLIALSLQFVLPLLFSGYQFHGGYLSALGLAAVYTISYVLAGAFLGLGLESFTAHSADSPKLVPLWVVLFWGLSALLLNLTTHVAPSLLSLSGWLPTLGAGLVLLIAGMLTGRRAGSCAPCRGNACSIRNEKPGASPSLTPDAGATSTGSSESNSAATGEGSTAAGKTGEGATGTAGSPNTSASPESTCGKGGCSCGKKGCARCSGKAT
jgi:hypothetical protein